MLGKLQPLVGHRSAVIGWVILIDVDSSSCPPQAGSWKQASSAVAVSLLLHALLLIVLSMIYFGLPERFLLDSVLSLVIASEEPLGESFDVELSGDVATPAESVAVADESAAMVDELSFVSPMLLEARPSLTAENPSLLPQQSSGDKIVSSSNSASTPKATASTPASASAAATRSRVGSPSACACAAALRSSASLG